MKRILLLLSLAVATAASASQQMSNVVCFLRFSDQTAQEWQHDTDYYSAMMNDEAEDANSVYNYFRTVSYGALQWNSTIVAAEYTDEMPRTYFCKYNETTAPDGYTNSVLAPMREQAMIQRLAAHLEAQIDADAVIDGNGDGVVDNLTIIVMGNSAISSSNLLWPHNDKMRWASASIHGKKISNYLIVFDKANGYKSLSPIALNTGVLCHEMMHSLDAYDLYSNNDYEPVNVWDLMSDNQVVPQGMTAYMRHTYGKDFGNWIPEIPELTTGGTYTINPLGSESPENVAYKIYPDKRKNEYFMVEYRRAEGTFEKSLPSSGLLVYRVDPSMNGNLSSSGYEVYIFRPSGSTTAVGTIAKAPLSVESGRTSFGAAGDSDAPYYFDGTAADFSITDVSECGETMSFTLTLGASGVDATDTDFVKPCYDAVSGCVVAPGAVNVTTYSVAGAIVTDLRESPSGMYIAVIEYGNGEREVLKFVR